MTDQHQLKDLADRAWARYQHWLGHLAVPAGTQLDLEGDSQASAQVNEWRGIWHACELELIRQETANGC